MDDIAAGRFAFSYAYEAINLIRLVQWGRADPDNVRLLIADAVREAKTIFPTFEVGINAAAADYEAAIAQGMKLLERRLAMEADKGTPEV